MLLPHSAPALNLAATIQKLNLCCILNLRMYKMPPDAATDTGYNPAGSKLRICSFCVLLSCRGKVTSYLMMRLPRCPGCLLMGIPSPLRHNQTHMCLVTMPVDKCCSIKGVQASATADGDADTLGCKQRLGDSRSA